MRRTEIRCKVCFIKEGDVGKRGDVDAVDAMFGDDRDRYHGCRLQRPRSDTAK